MDNEAYQVSTPLFRAITTGDTATVQKLLSTGADPNESYGADEETALLVQRWNAEKKSCNCYWQPGHPPTMATCAATPR
ncbi:MAG: ankyrin repeat domain-containing protein [Akkermansiaceae bacterium]|nr:ankyrin repeat domain-containing protein [Akkermansiaceae bacterium]